MRRSFAWPVTVILAGVTGAVLAATSGTLSTPGVGEPRGTAGVATVRAFYDSVNVILMSGDAMLLDQSLASDFVDHAVSPGQVPTRDGLARALLDLRVTFPALRLVPEDVAATGDRVVARVRVEGAEDGRFLGLPLGGAFVPWGPIDVFRVAGERVVERWGTVAGARFEHLGAVPLGSLAGTPQILSLSRWTFPPRTHLEITAGEGTHYLAAETGDLTVTIVESPGKPALVTQRATGDPAPVLPGTSLDLAFGAVLTLTSRTNYLLRNVGDTEITAVAVGIVPPGADALPTVRFDPAYSPPAISTDAAGVATFPGDVTMRPLAESQMIFLPTAPATLALGRVVLAPTEQLPPNPVAGPVLIAVDAGRLDLDTGTGRVWVRRGVSGASSEAAVPSLDTGDGAFVATGTDLGLRNRTTTLVAALVLTFMPAEARSDPV